MKIPRIIDIPADSIIGGPFGLKLKSAPVRETLRKKDLKRRKEKKNKDS